MDSPKTRVNSSMLPKHAGQYVCVVGKNLGVSTVQLHHSNCVRDVLLNLIGRWGLEG